MDVLIADDSPLFAAALQALLEAYDVIRVVAVARDGQQAVQMARTLKPDVLLLDIMMPVMDGLEATERIMAESPIPILAMSSDPRGPDGERVIEALRRGALDLVEKPNLEDPDMLAELVERLQLVSSVTVVRHVSGTLSRVPRAALRSHEAALPETPSRAYALLAIVASTGGPPALAHLLEQLPESFPLPIAIVQHMASGFASTLASYLDRSTRLTVGLATASSHLTPGHVVIAPDGHNIECASRGRLRLDPQGYREQRPPGDQLLNSVARVHGAHAMGLVLTGMGSDGAEGLLAMRQAGAMTLVQSPETCRVDSMPRAAIVRGAALRVVSLEALPRMLCDVLASNTGSAS